ncbi:MAG TPA: RNA methyltransferase [Gammaproteobacteria bacterium]|nr:RNA methyltransferase [Gammaproteobacteria bacterium]
MKPARDQMPIRIVLTQPSHAGNVGAAARAMKTMGLTDLWLVAPREFPSAAATARASGADDILAAARKVESLPQAIADCVYVVGASARIRSLSWPSLDPRRCAAELWAYAAAGPVAVVFGPEQAGLTNEDLARCQALVHIPANPAYSSLNLAMAVQVICYEIRMAQSGVVGDALGGEEPRDAPLATADELEALHAHLEDVMRRSRYLNPDHPQQLKLRLRRLFNRARLDQTEVNILRGLLAAVDTGKAPRE